MVAMAVSFAFVGCGDDEDEGDDGKTGNSGCGNLNQPSYLVGTKWLWDATSADLRPSGYPANFEFRNQGCGEFWAGFKVSDKWRVEGGAIQYEFTLFGETTWPIYFDSYVIGADGKMTVARNGQSGSAVYVKE